MALRDTFGVYFLWGKKCSSDLAKSHIKLKKVEPRDKKRVVPRAKSQGGKRQTVALRATSGR